MSHIQVCLTLESYILLMLIVASFTIDWEGGKDVLCKDNETGYLYEIMFTSKGVVETAI